MRTKKLLSIFLSMAILLSLFVVPVSAETAAPTEKWSDNAAATFNGGNGTVDSPYEIATAEQLAKLAVDVNLGVYGQTHSAEYFILTEDIDLGGKLWTPIGTGTTEGSYHSFDGYFDGNNKTISNMYVDESASGSSAGLFGNMYARGSDNTDADVDYVVKNLTIENATVITAGGEYTYAGILAGYASVAYPVNDIKIINCHVSGTVTTTGRAGGLIGSANYITADNCSADAVVTGNGFTGGFVGDLFYPAVSGCTAKGTVNGTWSAGGFAGVITNQLNADTAGVKNCVSYVDVTASNWNAGGFAGYFGGTDIEKCVAYGDVTSTVTDFPPKLGGFAGSLEPCIGYREGDSSETYYASLTNCYYAGKLTSAHPSILPSGLAAIVTDSTITDCAYDGDKNPDIKGYDGETASTALSTSETGSEICENVLGGHQMEDEICTRCGYTTREIVKINSAITLTTPVAGEAPQSTIETDEYTATVSWSPEVTDKFAYETAYTATITITPGRFYTVAGIEENGYTIEGAETVTNEADSGVITVTFPATGSEPSDDDSSKPSSSGGGGLQAGGDKSSAGADNLTPDTENKDDDKTPSVGETDDTETDDTDETGSGDTDAPQSGINPFADVAADDWYCEDVKYVSENGLMNGISENAFSPSGAVTRAMLVTVLYRAEGEPLVGDGVLDVPFGDIDMNAYYANAVAWAKQNNIVNGVSETEFAPDAPITREQIAAIMYRYAQAKGYAVGNGDLDAPQFADADEISEYALAAMTWAVNSGMLNGKGSNTLAPKDSAIRAEIAAILRRFIEANK